MSATRCFRFDHGELRAPVRTPEGFLRVEGFVGRAGIYEYINNEKDAARGYGPVGSIRRELRPAEEVFREDALAGFEGATLTANHPGKLVDVGNVRAYEVGTATRGQQVGDRVAAAMVIKDPKTIAAVEKGKLRKLSPGYTSMIHKTPGADKRYAYPGNPEGKYDVVQRDIMINHLALCERARGGEDLQIRMDGLDDVATERRDDDYYGGDDDPSPELLVMTTSVAGHQHTLDPADPSGRTSNATSEGADAPHSHEFVRTADGKITIAENTGHTHEVDNATLGVRADAALDAAQRDDLSSSSFAVPSKRMLPLENRGHVIAAMGGDGFGKVKHWDSKAQQVEAFHRILARAKEFGIDASNFEKEWASKLGLAEARNDSAATRLEVTMDKDEQIRSLKAQLTEALAAVEAGKTNAATVQTRADAADAKVKTLEERVTELEAKLSAGHTALETAAIAEHAQRADAAEAKLKAYETEMPDRIRKSADVRTKARTVMGAEFRCDGQTDRAVQTTVIKRFAPQENLGAEVSDAYVAQRFDSLVEKHAETARSLSTISQAADGARGTTRRETRADSGEELSYRDQWKKGLPGFQNKSE